MIPWITYEEAITEALRVEMRHDAKVICVSSEGSMNGGGKPAEQLLREFGPGRVREPSPLESMLSAAQAAASEGLRPVCEVDLAELADGGGQIAAAVESASLALRVVWGGTASDSAPEGLERWLKSAPSVKSVAPATAADAKGLLISAIRDPGPVCFLECRDLYRSVSDEVPEGNHAVALGEARAVAEGSEMILVAHGPAVIAAEVAAGRLGGEVEVIDLRSLRPLDRRAISSGVRQTGKVLIAEAAQAPTGVQAEVENLILKETQQYLDAPVRQLSLLELPAGSGPNGEWVWRIGEACGELIAF